MSPAEGDCTEEIDALMVHRWRSRFESGFRSHSDGPDQAVEESACQHAWLGTAQPKGLTRATTCCCIASGFDARSFATHPPHVLISIRVLRKQTCKRRVFCLDREGCLDQASPHKSSQHASSLLLTKPSIGVRIHTYPPSRFGGWARSRPPGRLLHFWRSFCQRRTSTSTGSTCTTAH